MFKQILVLPALALLLLTSCNSNGCYETTDVKVYCSFYSLNLKKAVSVDSVTVRGIGSDSIIYNNKTLSALALDLNPNAQQTQYQVVVKTKDYTFTDTLSFVHTNQPWFESMECGCMVFSTLDTCTTTGSIFQSATILDPKIINQKKEHVVLNI